MDAVESAFVCCLAFLSTHLAPPDTTSCAARWDRRAGWSHTFFRTVSAAKGDLKGAVMRGVYIGLERGTGRFLIWQLTWV